MILARTGEPAVPALRRGEIPACFHLAIVVANAANANQAGHDSAVVFSSRSRR